MTPDQQHQTFGNCGGYFSNPCPYGINGVGVLLTPYTTGTKMQRANLVRALGDKCTKCIVHGDYAKGKQVKQNIGL